MPARIVGDHGVRHAVPRQFERGEQSALVARARLVDPYVNWNAGVVREIDRRGRGAVIDRRQPAGVAMRQDVERAIGVLRVEGAEQREAMRADRLVERDVLVADRIGARESGGGAVGGGEGADCGGDLVERPFEVDRGRARFEQQRVSGIQCGVRSILGQRHREAVRGGRADQRSAARPHLADRDLGVVHAA